MIPGLTVQWTTRLEGSNISISGCFLGTCFSNSWVVCNYELLDCHSPALRWSATSFKCNHSFLWRTGFSRVLNTLHTQSIAPTNLTFICAQNWHFLLMHFYWKTSGLFWTIIQNLYKKQQKIFFPQNRFDLMFSIMENQNSTIIQFKSTN